MLSCMVFYMLSRVGALGSLLRWQGRAYTYNDSCDHPSLQFDPVVKLASLTRRSPKRLSCRCGSEHEHDASAVNTPAALVGSIHPRPPQRPA